MESPVANERLTARLAPLLALLEPAHGERLRAVIAYGPWVDGDYGTNAAQVLVVIDDASTARLRPLAARIGQLQRQGIEPLFLATAELTTSLDVFPLEFLDMQASRAVLRGDDLLADLEFPPRALRLQCEEELRSLSHGLRQEVARNGHRPRTMRRWLADSFTALVPLWRGLLQLRGTIIPAQVDALLQETARSYGLDLQILEKLRQLANGAWRPEPAALDQLTDEFDALLGQLIDLIDAIPAEA